MPLESPVALSEPLERKRLAVLKSLEEALGSPSRPGSLAVAFSGGVDSTLLLKLAALALGPSRVVAITARSESLPAEELAACRRLAATIGTKLIELRTNELSRKGYAENSPDRCYHCKAELFETLDRELATREGIAATAYGLTADDLAPGEHRPGMRAASEHGILRPLADAGLSKAEIRELSRFYGLETWDKPAMACLASRIPYGQPVTKEKLSQVERAEALLRSLGFRELRVRHHQGTGGAAGDTARLELAPAEIARAASSPAREAIARGLRELGFKFVTLDLEGFRSGRLNEGVVLDRPHAVSQGAARPLPLA
jgi:uncharacterized protein